MLSSPARCLLQRGRPFSTTPARYLQRLSRKDRGGLIAPGPNAEPWVVLLNEMSSELCRMRRDAKTFSVQERLLQRSDEFLSARPVVELRALHTSGSVATSSQTIHLPRLLIDVRALAVDAVSFHLRAVIGKNAAAAEQQLQRISRSLMKLMDTLQGFSTRSTDVNTDAAQAAGLLLLSASFVCRGIREWELQQHEDVLAACSREELRLWESRLEVLCPHTSASSLGECFWPREARDTHLGRQRRWLLTLPMALLSASSRLVPPQWNNRLNLVALANILAVAHENPLPNQQHGIHQDGGEGAYNRLLDAMTLDLKLFPVQDHRAQPSSSDGATTPPRWALGVLAPLLGSPSFLRRHWWHAHTKSIALPPSIKDNERRPAMSNAVKLASMMNAVKSVTVSSGNMHTSLVPFSSGKSSPATGPSHRHDQSGTVTVNPAMRRVNVPSKALDNTLIEVSALTHDMIAAVPIMSTLECRDLLRALHDRSGRPCANNFVGKRLLEASLRVLLLRYARLLDKAVDRGGSTKHRLSALQRQSVDEELARFREVYRDTSDMLLRWNIADEDVPPAYWAAVKQYLD